MLEKSLEEIILDEKWNQQKCTVTNSAEKCRYVKELAQSIKAYYLAKLPKEKHKQYVSPFEEKQHLKDIGYNQAIAEMHKVIEEE